MKLIIKLILLGGLVIGGLIAFKFATEPTLLLVKKPSGVYVVEENGQKTYRKATLGETRSINATYKD